jgi:multicomponent Na+:H+ antiporter subunit E
MRPWFSIRRVLTVAALVFVWCALWGEASVANLASGLLVAVAIVASGVGTGSPGSIRVGPLLRFAGLVAIDLASSTVSVAREVLTPTDRTDEAIIAVDLPRETRMHLLMMIVAVTVTPGTAVVDADADTGTLYLHLLHAERTDTTRAHVRRLADLACQALPVSREDLAA